jgi:hypothetical protein
LASIFHKISVESIRVRGFIRREILTMGQFPELRRCLSEKSSCDWSSIERSKTIEVCEKALISLYKLQTILRFVLMV